MFVRDQPETSGRGELRWVLRVFFFFFSFLLVGGSQPRATVPHRPVVRGSGCQGGARIQNPVVFLLCVAESPPCLVSDGLAAGCCGASVKMNEVFSAVLSEVAARTLRAWEQKWQDAALSPHLSTDGQTVPETT